MSQTTRVDLHCHSLLSDGQLEPEDLAERLAAAGVAFAALTDHDTVDGLARFRAAASRRGVACLSGVELTVQCDGREAHLLGYGFDPNHSQLRAALEARRQWRQRELQNHGPLLSIADNLRHSSSMAAATGAADLAASEGLLEIAAAIDILHRAGGQAFLAHPLLLERDRQKLRQILTQLKAQGLDGLEAIYAAFAEDDRRWLCELAEELGLLISAGVDQHAANPAIGGFGIEMPTPLWRRFRQAVASGRGGPEPAVAAQPPPGPRLRQFALHIILPTVLAIALFTGGIFGIFLPTLERALLDRKREMIRELTNSAWSILAEANREELAGLLTRQQAQELAKTRIESMRYGREGKDYFWLQDLHPRMVMHPYRKDLNGQDVTSFRDARGAAIFVAFAELVRRQKEGYVEYVWQWKDDPARLAPKESYIRGFEPWDWIIGTGIYIEDVSAEIGRIERGLVYGSVAISVLVALLLCYVMRESLRLERKRSTAERHMHESSERYRWLVEAASEGTLLVLEGRCRYANPMLLEMLGLSWHELELMDLEDLLGPAEDNVAAWQAIAQIGGGAAAVDGIAARLHRRDKSQLACRISLRPVDFTGRSGLILLARPESAGNHEEQQRALIDRLLQIPSDVATDLARDVAEASDVAQVAEHCRRTDQLVRSLLDCGAHPRHVTRMVASVCDAATARLVDLAMADLGAVPARFAMVALGSQGRREQTLCTDQDNAIIYAEVPGADPAAVSAYFGELGRRVCDGLAQAGYAPCRGGVMASNPRWSQPLGVWQRYFSEWIVRAEPRELLDFSIFFDFRAVYGDETLVSELRAHVQTAVAATPEFFPHFAQHALLFKPPLGLFGRIVTGGAGSESAGLLDLKAAMMPIVSFARLYALRYAVAKTGTLDRLAALAAQGVLLESTRQEMEAAYESLMRLRLRHQSDAMQVGQAADNLIAPQSLGHIEKAILKESFTEIEAVQHRLSYDFLGGEGVL